MSAGTLIRVLPKTMFDFAWVPSSTTESIVVARAVNVIQFHHAYLWVRVYSRRVGASASASVVVTGTLPADDSQQSFLQAATTTLAITGAAPTLLDTSLTLGGALPPYLYIVIQAIQPAVATNIGVEISIDILARCA
jgi:hypothetical protein